MAIFTGFFLTANMTPTIRVKHPHALLANLPSEIWIEIFRIATLYEDFESHTFADGHGDEMFPGQHQIFRQALVRRVSVLATPNELSGYSTLYSEGVQTLALSRVAISLPTSPPWPQ